MIGTILIILGIVLFNISPPFITEEYFSLKTRRIFLLLMIIGTFLVVLGFSIVCQNYKTDYYKIGNIDGMKGLYYYQLQEIDSNNFEDYIKKGEK